MNYIYTRLRIIIQSKEDLIFAKVQTIKGSCQSHDTYHKAREGTKQKKKEIQGWNLRLTIACSCSLVVVMYNVA